ncbi:MAG: response regulator transcription factor [Oscillospiraceae bacterium]|nr:response regulator transcription factor [Oscillospiraceae bacterium]MBR4101086.1 response regulator transcription factor [Oscillospiraceae bacterium]MBR6618393.1 response regulator transcription factor [Oscillospiraceae bacterium]
MAYQILICDDEKDIVNALEIYLSQEDYILHKAYNGKEALAFLADKSIDLLLLDIMMPEMDGIQTMVELRKNYNLPVILLTAKSEDTDKILGLNLGADDYITKPFNPMEVLARVRSQLRRFTQLGSVAAPSSSVKTIGNIQLNDAEKRVLVDGDAVNLTPTEYAILHFLMQSPNKVFTPKEIYTAVRNEAPYGAEGTIAVHIRHLREKIEINPAEPRYLKAVWGQGYKMEAEK